MTDIGEKAPPSTTGEAEQDSGGGFGLVTATAMIMGSIIGVGVFNIPASLAGFGPISLISMALTTVGAICLALLFGSLSRRLPADGGPYAYARSGFGNLLGFANAWSYWITAWAGNAAIAVGWVAYVEVFVNQSGTKWGSILLVLVGLWLPAIVNLTGVKNMGVIQVVTTILKFAGLVFVCIVGLFYIKTSHFSHFNISHQGAVSAILSGMAIALFSYIGVEVASVAAAKVRNPDKNVGRATIIGTLATAVVYIVSLFVIFGVLTTSQLTSRGANPPFSAAVNSMFGGTAGGKVMAVVVIISGIGALNGWTMICAEMPLAAAKDGLFPEPFRKISKAGVPAVGIIASTALASIAIIINYIGSGGADVFTTLVLMTGITCAIPYAFSALAQLKWRFIDHRTVETPRFVRDMIVALLALIFSVLFIIYSRNTDHAAGSFLYWAPFIFSGVALALGIPVYLAMRSKMTQPEPVPEFR